MGATLPHYAADWPGSRTLTAVDSLTMVAPVTVAVLAGSRLAEDCLMKVLRSESGVCPLSGAEVGRADVVLILTTEIDEPVLDRMAQIAAHSAATWKPVVLVCERIGEQQVLKAMDNGLASVIFWPEATVDNLVEAILGSWKGHAAMPDELVGVLMRRMRSMRAATSPSAQVTAREIDVIRLLGDGLGTLDIAAKMNFSERTIKNIIGGLCARFDLQNRVHLVAFAFRNGII